MLCIEAAFRQIWYGFKQKSQVHGNEFARSALCLQEQVILTFSHILFWIKEADYREEA